MASSYSLRLLCAVLAAGLLAAVDAERIERPADDVVAHARQIANAAAANKHDAVLLQVVALAWDVDRDLFAVAEAHAADLPQSRVRLLGGHGANLQANALLKRALIEHGALRELPFCLATAADQLVNRWHCVSERSTAGVWLLKGINQRIESRPSVKAEAP